MTEQQCTADVLMIRPASFCFNAQTADSNRFQQRTTEIASAQAKAANEFDALANALRSAGVRVVAFDDTPVPETPDALFPNNWVSFHSDGRVVLYPMLAPNRRQERRSDILESLVRAHGFRTREVIDLTHGEAEGQFLEGTGSVVLDRAHRIAYACLSPRTQLDLLGEFSQRLDYDLVAFEAADDGGTPIYHTNVLMSVGRRFAIVCVDAIASAQRASVLDALRTTGQEIVAISREQLSEFAGNVLELASAQGGHILAMSERAAKCFTRDQREQLQALAGPFVTAPIPTIETLGGGSVRCMLAEIHLPRAAHA